jgi:hypothetical protein
MLERGFQEERGSFPVDSVNCLISVTRASVRRIRVVMIPGHLSGPIHKIVWVLEGSSVIYGGVPVVQTNRSREKFQVQYVDPGAFPIHFG